MITGRALVSGRCEAPLIVLSAPLSFWGGVDAASGRIVEAAHPERGASLAGMVVALPAAKGSSSSGSVIAETLRAGCGPAGMIIGEADAILAAGVITARMLYGIDCPLAVAPLDGLEGAAFAAIRAGEERAEIWIGRKPG